MKNVLLYSLMILLMVSCTQNSGPQEYVPTELIKAVVTPTSTPLLTPLPTPTKYLPPYTVTRIMGPQGLPNHVDIEVDPSNDRNLYATNQENIYYSTNGGLIWKEVLVTTDHEIFDIEVCASKPNELFIAGKDMIGKSSDSGKTWTLSLMSGLFYYVVCDPSNSQIVYAVDYNGRLYQSENGGSDWDTILSVTSPGYIAAILINEENPNEVFVGTDKGLKISNNRGGTWVDMPSRIGKMFTSLARYSSDGNEILYAETEYGVYKTSNRGQSWTKIYGSIDNGGLPQENIREAITIVPGSPDMIFLNFRFVGVLRSKDGGVSWENLENGLSKIGRRVVVSKQNPNTVFYVSYGASTIMKSTDYGDNWVEITGQMARQAVWSLAAGERLYASVGGGGIYYSTDKGKTWHVGKGMEIATEIMEISINPVDQNIVYAIDFDYHVWKTENSGENWQLILEVQGRPRDIEISPTEPDTIYMASSGEGIYRSQDAGQTWSLLTNGIMNEYIAAIGINPNNSEILYCSTARLPTGGSSPTQSRVFRSKDEGSTWEMVFDYGLIEGGYDSDIVFDPIETNRVYVTFLGKPVITSIDNGSTWQEVEGLEDGGGKLLVIALDQRKIMFIRTRFNDGARVVINISGKVLEVQKQFRHSGDVGVDLENPGMIYYGDIVRGLYQIDISNFLNSVSE